MKPILAASCLFVSLLLLSFFTVFAFHAQPPLQEEVKTYLETGQGQLPFSQNANSHMHDVFVLLSWARIIAAIAVTTLLTQLSTLTKRNLQIVSSILILAPLILAVMDWNTLFTFFHEIFFPQGNWVFPANSLLIQTYPIEFFIRYSILWGCLLIVSAIVLYVLSQKLPAFVSHQEV